MNKSILILGGYGNFGKRIVSELAKLPNITLYIAGPDQQKADQVLQKKRFTSQALLKSVSLDIDSEQFERNLRLLSPNVIIHTAGPFQAQSYRVARAAIGIGAHYVDLADDRAFVEGITELDQAAKENALLVISGASSVPGLSSTVVTHYREHFSELSHIDIAIAPGNKAERGLSTIRGILKGTGQPFLAYENGEWLERYGWMNVRLKNFGGDVGRRWLANVNVPDLGLFPAHFDVKDGVRFQAGLELTLLHWVLFFMAGLAKQGWIKDVSQWTRPMAQISRLFQTFGTDIGAMEVKIKGKNNKGNDALVRWQLTAKHGIGPYVPTIAPVLLAKKMIQQEPHLTGAMPCLGLFSLDEFTQFAESMGISIKATHIG
ncbi:MAG: saccharopine dehydrogenase NADP-binding domain-containing protein [Cellvibrionales bacterium]|nr:saccharopine dehydrogenase NADP-binding domain-containing protein [Cellvibrionales bacterium]